MNRLNYFNPYDSKSGSHEDQLTRAYLVLLKHSSHTFFAFVEYCRSKHAPKCDEKPVSINNYLAQGWEIETQKGNPEINTEYLLSVLITDKELEANDSRIESSERNARYDGIITFGSNLTMVIENKPRSESVWFGQLKPSRQNLADETKIYSSPVILEWKEIIKQLNHLSVLPTISGNERLLIEDFLELIDYKFPFLNPYDSLHQCKGNVELVERRIYNLLKSIAIDESKVNYHRGGGYYIQTPYREIQQIGLIYDREEGHFELCLYFGDSQRQAKAFYQSDPNCSHLNTPEWACFPHFHVSFMSSNLVWFKSENREHYLQFWKDNVDDIRQQKREDIPNYLKRLVDENVILMPKETDERLKEKFYNTVMQNLNICPGFGVLCFIKADEAEELDKTGKLKFLLVEKIRDALKVAGLDGKKLLKIL